MYSNYNNSYNHTRSQSMESAALTLALISVIGCTCLYVSIPCGALAVIFALLSRGGTCSLSRRAMTALCLGLAGLVICGVFYAYSYYTMIHSYGSLQNAIRAYCDSYGLDYESLFQAL